MGSHGSAPRLTSPSWVLPMIHRDKHMAALWRLKRGQSSLNPQLQTHSQGISNTDGRAERQSSPRSWEHLTKRKESCKHSEACQTLEPKLKPPLLERSWRYRGPEKLPFTQQMNCQSTPRVANREEELHTNHGGNDPST